MINDDNDDTYDVPYRIKTFTITINFGVHTPFVYISFSILFQHFSKFDMHMSKILRSQRVRFISNKLSSSCCLL